MLQNSAQCAPCAVTSPSNITIRKEGRLASHKDRVFDLSWSPTTSTCLASVGQCGGFVWSIESGTSAKDPVFLAGTELMRICWHPHGAHVLTGSAEGEICIRAASDGAAMATLGASTEDEVYGLEMLSNEGLLAAGAGNTVQQWDLNRATRVAQATFSSAQDGVIFGGPNRNPEGKAYLFSLAARGHALCAALSDGTVRLLDSQTLQTIAVLDEHAQRGTPAFGVAISPTLPLLASADGQGAVLLWDLRRLDKGPIAQANHDDTVHSLTFCPGVGGSAELLVTGGADKRLRVHETQTSLATKGSARVLSELLCVKVAPDGAMPRLATAGGSGGLISDASISLWHLEANDEEVKGEATGGAEKRKRITTVDCG
mmetsp:Transcript_10832/g.18164  ORF Transcript_10832/g.18164 Transcript_10832/m.18164 type:complete len:372 (-) Transcript_10832:299-1414(-)